MKRELAKRIGMGLAVCVLAATGWHGFAAATRAAQAASPDTGKKTILVPAVSFTSQGDGNVKTYPAAKAPERLAGGYVHFWCTPGHWLEWTVEAPAAGDYQVGLHYAMKYPVSRGLSVNRQAVKGLESFTLPPTGRWSDWKDATLSTPVALKAGKNVLRMTCLDDFSTYLGELRLTAGSAAPIVVSAARFTGQGGGAVQVLAPATQGYIRQWASKGHWLEWSVEAPAAGEYEVHLLYANDALAPRELQVNGQVVKGAESFVPITTGEDRNWSETRLPANITLKQGKNALRLTSLGGGELSLSAIRLVSPASKVEVAAVLPAPSTRPAGAMADKPPAIPAAAMGPALTTKEGTSFKPGDALSLGGRKATVREFDVLPYVENEFSKRYVYESIDNPLLKQLREGWKLDQVVASAGKGEFEKQLVLMEWVYNQWDFGHAQELYNEKDPFVILRAARQEHKFQCMHSAAVFQAAANSLGWVSRQMAIPQHTFNEVWSNEHRRWVMMDATSNYAPERAGVPRNTFELRQTLLYEDGNGMVSLRRKGDEFTRTPKDPKYGQRLLFVGYIPNTNNLLQGPQYGGMYITKDKLAEGKTWHTRVCPQDPANEPYFPINQAAISLAAESGGMKATMGTMTPNFREFQVRLDGGEWKTSPPSFPWPLHKGANRLEARSVNKFNVPGPVSTVALDVAE